jgi:hypothetical protein
MGPEGWISLAAIVIQAVLFGAIFRKAGYNPFLGLLMAIPLVNLITLVWFATAHWPLEDWAARPTHEPQADADADANWGLKAALRKALFLERRGESARAIEQFDRVAAMAGQGHPTAAMARERAQQLRTRLANSNPTIGPASPAS